MVEERLCYIIIIIFNLALKNQMLIIENVVVSVFCDLVPFLSWAIIHFLTDALS